MVRILFFSIGFYFLFTAANAQNKQFRVHTVAFYNFENLFDTINGPNYDEEWLPDGAQNWTGKKYRQKLDNLSRVLSEIGIGEHQKEAPVLIGGCEIENRNVLEDLVAHPKMAALNYGIIHFESPDRRGIDVALLYKKEHFQPVTVKTYPLYLYDKSPSKEYSQTEETPEEISDGASKRIYTRDQLVVSGLLNGELIHIIVNHWPSRSGGEKKTKLYREAAAQLNRNIADSIFNVHANAKLISMGDFNDGSFNNSIRKMLGAKGKKQEVKPMQFFNPMQALAEAGMGTLAYRDAWDLFDMIFVSEAFLNNNYTSWRYWKAGIFNKPYLLQRSGQFKGYPLRNANGEVGFSDHLPVYIYLIKEAL